MDGRMAAVLDGPSARPKVPWPFERVRGGQAEFLADAREALAAGAHLLAHAPTGIGKTAGALVAALEVALERDLVVLFLTSRQSQHRIAIETVRRLQAKGAPVAAVDVIAKQAMCLQEGAPAFGRSFHAFCDAKVRARGCEYFLRDASAVAAAVRQRALHVQDLVRSSAACGVCPHKVAMEAAAAAHVVVCDYNSVFSDIREAFLGRLGRPLEDLLLIVDEAHNLPDRIRSHLCGDLSPRDLTRAARDAYDLDPETYHRLLAAARAADAHLAGIRGERVARRVELLEVIEAALALRNRPRIGYADLVEAVGWAADEATRLGRTTSLPDVAEFLARWQEEEDAAILRLLVGGPEGKFAFRLLDPSVLSRGVFQAVRGSLLMSGTLHPPEMYADLLGIPEGRRRVRRYASPFPESNRLLLVHPGVTTVYAQRTAEMFDRMAREVATIAASAPGNVAAFFPSYAILRECGGRLAGGLRKRLLVERPDWDKARRDGALAALRAARAGGGALLLGVQGGSLSEGVDYDGNLLDAVVVVGLPLSPPNVELDALKAYYAQKFGPSKGYDYAVVFPAVNKVLQAAGRPIRSERDRAAIVVLEGRLVTPRYARYLPDDFAPRASRAPADEVARFLRVP